MLNSVKLIDFMSYLYNKVIVCNNGYLSIVKVLIEVGVDLKVSNEYKILFLVVCDRGNFFIVYDLMKVGVGVNFDKNGKIFFIFVCGNRFLNVVEEMINMDVKVIYYCYYILLMILCKMGYISEV